MLKSIYSFFAFAFCLLLMGCASAPALTLVPTPAQTVAHAQTPAPVATLTQTTLAATRPASTTTTPNSDASFAGSAEDGDLAGMLALETPDPNKPTEVPEPTSQVSQANVEANTNSGGEASTQPGDIFGPMTVCGEAEYDASKHLCTASRTDFSGNVQRVYATWSYQHVTSGMKFSRRWYKDGKLLWETRNTVGENPARWPFDGTPAYIYADTREGSAKRVLGTAFFATGNYTIELLIAGKIVQTATFVIR